jgi:hypothetical protein
MLQSNSAEKLTVQKLIFPLHQQILDRRLPKGQRADGIQNRNTLFFQIHLLYPPGYIQHGFVCVYSQTEFIMYF